MSLLGSRSGIQNKVYDEAKGLVIYPNLGIMNFSLDLKQIMVESEEDNSLKYIVSKKGGILLRGK